MECFRIRDGVPQSAMGAVATIGSFDGLHIGHRDVIAQVSQRAHSMANTPSMLITFEPHPRITLSKAEGLLLITTFEEKCELLGMMGSGGVDYLAVIDFTKQFSEQSDLEFLQNCICSQLHCKELNIGYNHHFGRGAMGSITSFDHFCGELHVRQIGECRLEGEKVSSTQIRKAVQEGDLERAKRMLGHGFPIFGDLRQGVMEVDRYKLLPQDGVYEAVTLEGEKAKVEISGRCIKVDGSFTDKHIKLFL